MKLVDSVQHSHNSPPAPSIDPPTDPEKFAALVGNLLAAHLDPVKSALKTLTDKVMLINTQQVELKSAVNRVERPFMVAYAALIVGLVDMLLILIK